MTAPTTRRVLVSISGNAFAPLAALVTMPIIARALGADGRGTVAAATAPMLLATTVASFGLPVAVTFFVARAPTSARRVLGPATGYTALFGAAATATIIAVAGLLAAGAEDLRILVCCSALAVVPTMCTAVLQAVAAGQHRWRAIATERLVVNGSKLAACSVLASIDQLSVGSCVAVLAIAPVLGAVAHVPGLRTTAPPTGATGPLDHRALLAYGARTWIGALSGILLSRIDQVLMVPLVGTAELGLYVVAVGLSEIPLIVNSAIREVLFVADAASADDASLTRAGRISTLATVTTALGVAAIASWAVPTLFGEEFTASLPACFVLLVGVVVGNPGSIAGVGLAARGRPGARSTSLAAACVVNVGALLALAGPYGAVGAAIATVLGNTVSGGLNLLLLRRTAGIPASRFLGLRSGDLRLSRSRGRHAVE